LQATLAGWWIVVPAVVRWRFPPQPRSGSHRGPDLFARRSYESDADHLDYHETFDAYFVAKAKLIGYLAENVWR